MIAMLTRPELIASAAFAILLLAACGSQETTEETRPAAYKPVPTFTSTSTAPRATRHASQAQPTGTPQSTPIPPDPTPFPTPIPPTATLVPSTPIPPAATPTPKPMVTINNEMNVRQGPGTNYPIVGVASPGQQYSITGKNRAGDWWEIDYDGKAGWVYAPLVRPTNASHVRLAAFVPAPPTVPKPTSTPRPPPTQTPGPIPLSQVERAPIWIGIVNSEYGWVEVFAQVSFKVDTYELDVLVHGEEYCNSRALYEDEPPTKLSCGILEYSHSSISDVRVRVNENLWSEGERFRCERNKASTQSHSVFACKQVD